jgi:tRNA threonylcarbamoyladenosine biosynthesis protein TsaB
MNLLGIDTTTGYLGVIAQKGEEKALFSANSGFRHGEHLMAWIEKILASLTLKPRELDLIVCALGPGSFTGLRIGLATAKGLSLAAGCPLAGVGSLDIYGARYGFFPGTVFPVIDARKSRFYTAAFIGGRRTSEYLDLLPEEVRSTVAGHANTLLTGPDAEKIFPSDTFPAKPDKISILTSNQELTTLLDLGVRAWKEHGPLPDGAGPLYVRPSEAELVKAKSHIQ